MVDIDPEARDENSIRKLPCESDVASWFSRLLALGYYDGPTEGIAECAEGHVAVLRLRDWDQYQDLRVFSVREYPDVRFDELEIAVSEFEEPTWPIFLPTQPLSARADALVQRLLDDAWPPDYLIASTDPTGTIRASRLYSGIADTNACDWFAEAGVTRREPPDG